MDITGVLRSSDLFGQMSDRALERLVAVSRQVSFGRGGLLFTEGGAGTSFFVLLEGEVRLSKTAASGQDVVLGIVRPPEVFAEVVLFENLAYPASATALSPVRVLAVDRASFLALLDDTSFRNEFIALLMRKQRYLAGRILYLAALDVEERFMRFLVDRYGTGGPYRVDLTKKDMAAAIGTIPETFSRLVNRLRRQGVLSWEGSTLRVDKDYLELFAQDGGGAES